MAFRKIEKTALPPRQWALVGDPGCGKSTFAAQMAGPILVIDADHRFTEVAHHAQSDVYELSDNAADNVNAERIAALLDENMRSANVKTIVVDSLTSILSPLVVQAILDNDAGRNRNRVAAFKDKAMAMRLIQDKITGWGCAVLWIYHTRTGLDSNAVQRETTSISGVELARLRRSLNMQLRMIADGNRRGIVVEWARRGRSGITLWDETGNWRSMPERIEQAVYAGLSSQEAEQIARQIPTKFSGPAEAVAWGWEMAVFNDAVHAQNSYDKLKKELRPKNADEMWAAWIKKVMDKKAEIVAEMRGLEDQEADRYIAEQEALAQDADEQEEYPGYDYARDDLAHDAAREIERDGDRMFA